MKPTRLLLDSHVLLWLLSGSPRLSPTARKTIQQAEAIYVSTASAWELRLKESKGKLRLVPQFEADITDAGLKELPVSFVHASAYRKLPSRTTDPFDRMLVAQAVTEHLALLTADRTLLAVYPRQTLSALKPH